MLLAEAVTKKFKRPVLKNLYLNALGGEMVGIDGENGSGKSTLLSILTGALGPDSGSVTLEGFDVQKNPRTLAKLTGFVPQENTLFANLSALDNMKLWTSAYGANWKDALPFLFPEGDESEMRDFLKKKTHKLSGGMKKRLSIAVSLAHDPRYLIMDEPSAGLDIGFRDGLLKTMAEFKKRGGCVVFTSHQPDELRRCDRIYVLRGGSFVYEGTPQNLGAGDGFAEALTHAVCGS
ncbi:MAG: ABC transporter ATP-binding protein [Defluviitaleaceae bacterium]|nr:ABC transporter ATP-binding protein [Defluviitaleaceae bacterium]